MPAEEVLLLEGHLYNTYESSSTIIKITQQDAVDGWKHPSGGTFSGSRRNAFVLGYGTPKIAKPPNYSNVLSYYSACELFSLHCYTERRFLAFSVNERVTMPPSRAHGSPQPKQKAL